MICSEGGPQTYGTPSDTTSKQASFSIPFTLGIVSTSTFLTVPHHSLPPVQFYK